MHPKALKPPAFVRQSNSGTEHAPRVESLAVLAASQELLVIFLAKAQGESVLGLCLSIK